MFVHLSKDVAHVFKDYAGESLHRRGYRLDAGEAPLKENLAAAVLRYSGWDRATPFCDPMCGAGTLAIEAAAWAMGRAPGLNRRFGFERWASFGEAERRALAELRELAKAGEKALSAPILARDSAARALELAGENARRAGVRLELERGHVGELGLTGPGTIATNPPYGRRLTAPAELGRELARLVDRHPDHYLALLMAAEQPMGRTRRRPEPARQVFNGDIECLVRLYAPVTRD